MPEASLLYPKRIAIGWAKLKEDDRAMTSRHPDE